MHRPGSPQLLGEYLRVGGLVALPLRLGAEAGGRLAGGMDPDLARVEHLEAEDVEGPGRPGADDLGEARDADAHQPTPPPDIDVEDWAQSIELVRQWRASTLLVTHFGAHQDPEHLDAMQTHLTTMADIARGCITAGGVATDQQSRFGDEMRAYVEQHVPADEAGLYGTAAPLDQCWLGLARYWSKRGVTGG